MRNPELGGYNGSVTRGCFAPGHRNQASCVKQQQLLADHFLFDNEAGVISEACLSFRAARCAAEP